jgi:hypothetical protein
MMPRVAHSVAMRTRHFTAALIATMVAISAAVVRAQDATPPMPDAAYGPSNPGDFQSPHDLSVPVPDVGPAPHSVTIPIPGGGQVSVEGPDAPDNSNIPTAPGGQWGIQQLAPTSQGSGPVGP